MNWLVILSSGVFLAIVLWLMVSQAEEMHIMPGKQSGSEETPYDPKQLVPIQYDRTWGERLQFQHEEMCSHRESSPGKALDIGEQMREANSAIVELNIFRIGLDQLERHGYKKGSEEWSFTQGTLNRAEALFEQEPDRYDKGVEDCLKSLKHEFNKL